jgi:KEOPS complex subunit Cgi121
VLKTISEYDKCMGITGFKDVTIEDAESWLKAIRIGKNQDVAVQLFDAEYIATWEHPFFAVLNALMAFRNRRNISRNLAVEVMLYASAQRQIRKAIELIGVKPGSSNVALVVVGRSPDAVENVLLAVSNRFGKETEESVLELSKRKVQSIRRAFRIGEKELETVMVENDVERALVNLVIERMALLSTQV